MEPLRVAPLQAGLVMPLVNSSVEVLSVEDKSSRKALLVASAVALAI